MGERKVQNKYYYPDCDPAKIPRKRKAGSQRMMNVRMMFPMSIRCRTCGGFIYRWTKFNSRMENVNGETYLGIRIFRFYFKCRNCSAEIIIRTDPKNSDYAVECGATRNFEPWRVEEERVEEARRKRDAEEMGDSVKVLENKALDSKRQMEDDADLEERKSVMNRRARVSYDAALEVLRRGKEEEQRKLDEKDKLVSSSAFEGRSRKGIVKRIADEEVDDDDDDYAMEGGSKRGKLDEQQRKPTDELIKGDVLGCKNSARVPILKNLSVIVNVKPKIKEQIKEVESNSMESLCQQYQSDEDD